MIAELAGKLTSPLVHVPLAILVLHLLGLFTGRRKLFGYCKLIPFFWLFLCSMTYPSILLIKSLEDDYAVVKVESDRWVNADAIVVLACNYFEDSSLPFVSKWPNCSLQRNLHAALMYKAHTLPIYLAGGILGPEDKVSQAFHNREFFTLMGVNENDIHTFPEGHNTETEVAALAPYLIGKRIALVTSASHLPRAIVYFESHGLEAIAIPVEHFSKIHIEPIIGLPNAASLYRSERAIHEYLGIIYQKIFM